MGVVITLSPQMLGFLYNEAQSLDAMSPETWELGSCTYR